MTKTTKQLKSLLSQREVCTYHLKRFEKFVTDFDIRTHLLTELTTRLQKIEQSWDTFQEIQNDIESLESTDLSLNQHDRVSFEENYFQLVAVAKDTIAKFTGQNNQNNQSIDHRASSSGHDSGIKLPTINLPQFNGQYSQWSNFSETFNALINKNVSLNKIQKFYYLKSALSGEALNTIHSLEVSEANYNTAWDLLQERFENKRIIIHTHVRALFEMPPLTKESHQGLRNLLDEYFKHIRALQNLGQPTETWDTLLIYLISNKLDAITKREWESSITKKEFPNIDEFISFLKNKCQVLEALSSNQQTSSIKYINKVQSSQHLKTISHVSQKSQCYFCKGSHYIFSCEKFLGLSVDQRLAQARQLHLCTNCLRSGHSNPDCLSKFLCKHCHKRHNSLLHLDQNARTEPNSSIPNNLNLNTQTQSIPNRSNSITQSQTLPSSSSTLVNFSSQSEPHILLSTAIIHVLDKHNNPVQCRALLDSGSQSNFMTIELFKQLGLPKQDISMSIYGINQSINNTMNKVQTFIKSPYNAYKQGLTFLILNKITENIPLTPIDPTMINIPDNVTLADPYFYNSDKVDILLGSEIFWDLICIGQIKMPNQPVLQKTKLGWILAGPLIPYNNHNKTLCHLSQSEGIQDQLERFWKIEECSQTPAFSQQEKECENHFIETTTRDIKGRFTVSLPLKSKYTKLGESLQTAIKRLESMERKFVNNPTLKSLYVDFMQEYEALGHMSKVNPNDPHETIYYLPHHGVFKESSSTTKLRVVFDGSAQSSSGISLNNVLKVGPTIQEDLFCILVRFRKNQVAFTADVAKMYRQVNILPSQRDLQRIVWRQNANDQLTHYQLNTVTYGLASSSYLAIRALQQVAHEHKNQYPTECNKILRDFYVDDFISGASTIEEAKELKFNLNKILKTSGFDLRKWVSNEPSILETQDDASDIVEYFISDTLDTKALGIKWNAHDDFFYYTIDMNFQYAQVTKRIILKIIAKIFDPLGLLGPIIICAKIILQQLWSLKLEWDESIPMSLFSTWSQFYSHLKLLNNFRIPRKIICSVPSRVEIHGFSDASERAYGACLYLKSIDSHQNVMTRLICAKSRVAPLRSITLPRLELSGAVLLAELTQKVTHSLDINIDETFYWCDSTIVLGWINSESKSFQTFIANRISIIQGLTSPNQWNHVCSKENPADLVSRGTDPNSLSISDLWWYGPSWLSSPNTIKPNHSMPDQVFESLPERKIIALISAVTEHNVDYSILHKYSTIIKLQRVVAYCLRFKSNLCCVQESRQLGNLSISELDNALITIIKMTQAESFQSDLKLLLRGKSVSRSSSLLALNPFLDHNDIIRVGGRISRAPIDYNQKHPIVIPYKHHVTNLIIEHEHYKLLHAGPQSTLASIRSNFWPIKGKSAVKQVLHKCIKCFRFKPKSQNPLMAELPQTRITPCRPFTNIGIDYAGPLYIKDGKLRNRKIIKCYFCSFVCLATKAIHLELVSDLTSSSFLNALKRFTSRRGMCSNIYSDNGSNFKGANNELHEIYDLLTNFDKEHEINFFLDQNRIHWHFIPAYSPHFGGIWEASIKSAKYHLKGILGDHHFTFEQLSTILVQIEAVLNSRPLTPLSDNPNDLLPLTPGHFLIGDTLTAVPQVNLMDTSFSRLNQYQHMQQLIQHFWKRWSKEYLSNLQTRSKWRQNAPQFLKIGAMVIMQEDNTPPMKWPLGRIVTLSWKRQYCACG